MGSKDKHDPKLELIARFFMVGILILGILSRLASPDPGALLHSRLHSGRAAEGRDAGGASGAWKADYLP